jgi:hypothetical protein
MADEAFLSGLSAGDAVRYKAFISASLAPGDVQALLGDALPPAQALDARASERLLLALGAAAKVFAMDLAEEAMGLHSAVAGGAGTPLSPGLLQEAYRRRLLRGEVLGCGEMQQATVKAAMEALGRAEGAGSSSGSSSSSSSSSAVGGGGGK